MNTPPNRPRPRARRAELSATYRRRRLVALTIVLACLVVVVAIASSGSGGAGAGGVPSFRTTLVAHDAPGTLPAPISGESVVGLPGGPLIIGGLDSSSASVSGVFQLDPSSGRLREAGALGSPLHDSAAAVVNRQVLIFGGGAATSTDLVQALPAPGGEVAAGETARQVGRLPTVRSDLSAVAIAGRAYVLGGYDGEATVDSVLRTADGHSFEQITTLPDPRRYMAVAALGGKIYAFGGETATGSPGNAIQEVDPAGGAARVVGHLPVALSHASAVVLGGRIYVVGGDAGGSPSAAIWRFYPAGDTVTRAGRLPLPVAGGAAATVGSTAYVIGGTGAGEEPLRSVVTLRLRREKLR